MHPVAEKYNGFILAERERNMYHDSYFVVTVWNPDTAAPESFEYAATAYGGSSPMSPEIVKAAIDATPAAVKFAAAKYAADQSRACAANVLAYTMQQNMFQHAEVFKGATVRVARGRKVRKGLTGVVLSVSRRVFGYNTERHYLFIDCGPEGSWTVDAANVDVVAHSPASQQTLFDLSN